MVAGVEQEYRTLVGVVCHPRPPVCWHSSASSVAGCPLRRGIDGADNAFVGGYPGGPVAKTLSFKCRGPALKVLSGTRSHMLQLRVCRPLLKDPARYN